MEPIKLIPTCKDYIWGGNLLRTRYNKVSDKDIIAESWELSCHKDGPSVVADGKHAGKTLIEYLESEGPKVLGTRCGRFKEFPIMIKLIDAKNDLSIQVHPDDEYALKNEGGYGKTEMWYVLDCEEDASLIYGFRQPISREEFAKRIKENTLMEVVNKVPVKKGDVFFIEAGTLHAVGKGIVLAEVQQSSNLTYRVYDYGRLGADNKPRELHIDKAIDVTNLNPPARRPGAHGQPEEKEGFTSTLLAECEYFHTEAVEVRTKAAFEVNDESFVSIICLEEDTTLAYKNGTMDIKKGDSVFLPAGMGRYEILQPCRLLVTRI
ncbi:MAG TPA: class I mannose-6-phosphate isomerase [Clostridiaceae bacterium]|jgi:mannose-6-phosphate isomerase|nr:class I mannose-6-phosphate isomerase [Clostridiaceae bacterium]